MIWPFISRLEQRRRKGCAQSTDRIMQKFLCHSLLRKQKDWREITVVALDLETTGLDPQKDQILSVGLVEIHKGVIKLDTAWHKIINVGTEIPEESAVIHQITDDVVADGEPLEQVLPELLKRLSGKVMLVHYDTIEQGFIDAACRKFYGSPFLTQTIDTLKIAHRHMRRLNDTVQPESLRLFNLRRTYGLPEYKAHNALYDALATAELFLAMTAEIAPRGKQPLGDYLN